jgi:hypothetical protein
MCETMGKLFRKEFREKEGRKSEIQHIQAS